MPLGLAHQGEQCFEMKLRVSRMGDALRLHSYVDADPLQAGRLQDAALQAL
jgi:hypothetical protein